MGEPPTTASTAQDRLQNCGFYKNIAERGYAVVPEVLSGSELAGVADALMALAAHERDERKAWYSHGNQRVFNLVDKGSEFLSLIDHPLALAMVEQCLGPHALLSSLTANVATPGNKPQPLHADQGHLPEPWFRAEAVNLVWVLDPFTPENGATRVVPGSHVIGVGPCLDTVPTMPIEALPGALICLDGRVWHGTGHNRTAGADRRALFAYYCRPYLRQQENFARSLNAGTRRTLTPVQRRLLGFDIWLGFGAVNGLPTDWMDGRERIGPTNADHVFPGDTPAR